MNKLIYCFGLVAIVGSWVTVYDSLTRLNSALAPQTAKSMNLVAR